MGIRAAGAVGALMGQHLGRIMMRDTRCAVSSDRADRHVAVQGNYPKKEDTTNDIQPDPGRARPEDGDERWEDLQEYAAKIKQMEM